jgi:anti-sigma factor ChrR (cupin superfamily)
MSQRRDNADGLFDPALLADLLGAIAPEKPATTLRADVLARIRAQTTLQAHAVRADAGRWRTVLPGIEVKTLLYDAAGGTVSFLLRAQPGARLPAHGHRMYEECLVLEGEFTMGDVTLHAGDFQTGHPGEMHPVAHTRTGVLVYLRGSADDYPFARPDA